MANHLADLILSCITKVTFAILSHEQNHQALFHKQKAIIKITFHVFPHDGIHTKSGHAF